MQTLIGRNSEQSLPPNERPVIYEFALTSTSALALIIGSVALALLCFIAGFVAGIILPAEQIVQLNGEIGQLKAAAYKAPVPQPAPSRPVETPAPAPAASNEQLPAAKPAQSSPVESSPEKIEEPEYSMQVGAFLNVENAAALIEELNQKGYPAFEQEFMDSRGRTWHLVRIGEFTSRADANQAANEFKSKENLVVVVRPRKSM